MAKKRMSYEERAERKRIRRVRVMGVIIIALMVLSSVAFAVVFYTSPTQGGATNTAMPGVNYEIRDNLIYADINDQEIYFYSFADPSIEVSNQTVPLVTGATVLVVAFDPADEVTTLYAEQIRWDLSQFIDVPQVGGILSESDQYVFPIVNCSSATPSSPVIIIKNESYAGVTVNGSCITIGGYQSELLRARDQFLYAYYGVR